MSSEEFGRLLRSREACHFVGIGGVSMSPLAEILRRMGNDVTGSDINENAAIIDLRKIGVRVTIGHSADNISGAGYIIRTAAAREDNVEIEAARERGVPIFERAQAWVISCAGIRTLFAFPVSTEKQLRPRWSRTSYSPLKQTRRSC